jgi:hypothetical protein
LRHALVLALGTALCVAPVALTGFLAAGAQTAPAPYKAPMTAFGQPDIGGYWSNATLTPMTRPAKIKDQAVYSEDDVKKLEQAVVDEVKEGNKRTDPNAGAVIADDKNLRPEFAAAGGAVGGYNRGWLDPGNQVMRVNGQPRTSLIMTPNGNIPPRKAQPASATTTAARPARQPGAMLDYETRSTGERCIIGFGRNGGPPMFPNGFYNNNYQIIQTPKSVMIEIEMNHDTRIVRLNEEHRKDNVRPYFGDAIGHWDGDTLVVETTNIPQSQQFAGSWEHLKVTERFKRVAKDRLYYSFTIEDPTMWDAAWGGEYEFSPLDGHLFEYACHEGNYALPGILSGNRHDVAAAEAKAAADKEAADKAAAAAAKPAAKPAKAHAKP